MVGKKKVQPAGVAAGRWQEFSSVPQSRPGLRPILHPSPYDQPYHAMLAIPTWPYHAIPCNAIQCPSLPSLPGALLRSPRYLTSITRPALCIPRATRCNNLGQFPAEVPSADVLAYQGLRKTSHERNFFWALPKENIYFYGRSSPDRGSISN